MCVPFWFVGAGGGDFGLLLMVGFLTWRQGRVCVPFWPVGVAGGPFWQEGKGACVCLFGLLEQLVGLFGMEARACVCEPAFDSPRLPVVFPT